MNYFILLINILSTIYADEGMWLFNSGMISKDKEWKTHVQLSTVRISTGCSGSFISQNGLVITNHHCIRSCIDSLSSHDKDYVEKGFYADNLETEAKCSKVSVEQLISEEVITSKIAKAVSGASREKEDAIKKETIAKIKEKCSAREPSVKCEVVSYYNETVFYLYKYRKYNDVRLVFSPEFSVAFFGGDEYNFVFPRYNFDIALLRLYEDGKPLFVNNYLEWKKEETSEGMPLFVSGYPGESNRFITVSEFEFQRDFKLIKMLNYYSEFKGILLEFENRDAEHKRNAAKTKFYVENVIKILSGLIDGSHNKVLYDKKLKEERRARTDKNIDKSFLEISKAYTRYKKIYALYNFIEKSDGFQSLLYNYAKRIIRNAAESVKPNPIRFEEFSDSNLITQKRLVLCDEPVYEPLEIATLTFSLSAMIESLGSSSDEVKTIMGNVSPKEMAEYLVNGTKLKNIENRKDFFEGGMNRIDKSKDPMILFALRVDSIARKIRKEYEDKIDSVIKRNKAVIPQAGLNKSDKPMYPDANSTLRISYGNIKGYKEDNKYVEPHTIIGGIFDLNRGKAPLVLPSSWLQAKHMLNLNEHFNFVTTNDIVTGNSGSPVVDDKARMAGVIFDGNTYSIGGYYGFVPEKGRAIAVGGIAILNILDKVYNTKRIINEIIKN